MTKFFTAAVAAFTSLSVFALPVGNPSEATLLCDGLFCEGHCADPCDPCLTWCDAMSLRFGFYGDYVFNRHLDSNHRHFDADIECTEIFTNAFYFDVNLWDRTDLFLTLGATNLFIETNDSPFYNQSMNEGSRLTLESGTDFSWSVGLRTTLWECGSTVLGLEGQYFQTKPHLTRVSLCCDFSNYPSSSVDLFYKEWQIGLGVAHRINILSFYAAIKYAHADLDFNDIRLPVPSESVTDFVTLPTFENEKSVGYAIGVSLIDCEKASVTVEGRFVDEKALYVNAQIRF